MAWASDDGLEQTMAMRVRWGRPMEGSLSRCKERANVNVYNDKEQLAMKCFTLKLSISSKRPGGDIGSTYTICDMVRNTGESDNGADADAEAVSGTLILWNFNDRRRVVSKSCTYSLFPPRARSGW